jgi:hypothetical protein
VWRLSQLAGNRPDPCCSASPVQHAGICTHHPGSTGAGTERTRRPLSFLHDHQQAPFCGKYTSQGGIAGSVTTKPFPIGGVGNPKRLPRMPGRESALLHAPGRTLCVACLYPRVSWATMRFVLFPIWCELDEMRARSTPPQGACLCTVSSAKTSGLSAIVCRSQRGRQGRMLMLRWC